MSEILRIAAPFTLWIVAFSAIYGLEGMICSRHGVWLGQGQGRLILIAAWLAAMALQGWLLWALWSGRHQPVRFSRTVSITLAIAALAATVWTLMPVATLSMCAAAG